MSALFSLCSALQRPCGDKIFLDVMLVFFARKAYEKRACFSYTAGSFFMFSIICFGAHPRADVRPYAHTCMKTIIFLFRIFTNATVRRSPATVVETPLIFRDFPALPQSHSCDRSHNSPEIPPLHPPTTRRDAGGSSRP